jgi:mannosyltransferase
MLALAVIGALTGDRRAGLFGATVLVPVLVFLAASEFAPLYTLRYMVFIAPLGCALAGLALARVRLAPALAVVLLLGFLCLKEQDLARVSHEGRGAPIVDYRGAARVIAQNRQPADVIVYDRTGWQFADIGIEYYLRGDTPTDVLAKSSRDAVGSYWTPEVADPAAALAAHKRVWAVVPNNLTTHKPDPLPAATVAALTQHYRAARTWHVSGITVWLYERTT